MDLVCFSHLRWNFVYQRPQHLMSRIANDKRVFYIEEPVFTNKEDGYTIHRNEDEVLIVVPHLLEGDDSDRAFRHQLIIKELFVDHTIEQYIFWYYTPMMLEITSCFKPSLIVFDCMDELSAFRFADPGLLDAEKRLLARADIVFTGGESLYEAKKDRHHNVHCFPSSIDYTHFSKARRALEDPADQRNIPHPRLGFFGVIDERFDIELLQKVSARMPDHQFVIIGPVVKIDPATLPQAGNIHYLGAKTYDQLPAYISGWDIALVLFALNESTRFISPTKTPEYLAAGKPVISTAIKDVVKPYGEQGFVSIVHSPNEFVAYANIELAVRDKSKRLERVDRMLAQNSWDITFKKMNSLMEQALKEKSFLTASSKRGVFAGAVSTARLAG